MKKVLGFAILATFLATPAFAGETFVRDENSWSNSVTKTNLMLDSKTVSQRNEKYDSWAQKDYVDGDINISTPAGGTDISFDEFINNTAGSELYGKYSETNWTNLNGTINTTTNSYTNSHETSAGVR
ncbi:MULTISPECIES: hypothetical protein [unclassified Nostoc]|uniref:hypothetical protein n=1 Tax=unclassified Nostoc TaxID=2593658 RepID=UPI002AD34854|nr:MULTISPECIES: hypothetical protein [unclassified Nostoc]MDZ8122225.1 hypothetical protein [Nostoc sp. CmiVER01]MDZ8225347.1 hypothetical protein [Nostoc sp. ChiVER01]